MARLSASPPFFVHAEPCARHGETAEVPALFLSREQVLIRGYGMDDRIVYGTGQVMPSAKIGTVARDLLARPAVAYLHLRSAGYNCYGCRIEFWPWRSLSIMSKAILTRVSGHSVGIVP